MSQLYTYALGPDPYPELSTDMWGTRKGKFPDLDSALHALLLAHPFPVVLTGRRENRFHPGISLPDTPASHVVQVWSSEPAIVKRYRSALSAHCKSDKPQSHHEGYVPHDGAGTHMGLSCEIHVGMIARYQTPKIAGLLTDGTDAANAASPAGRMALSFTPQARSALQLRMFQSQLANVGGQHDIGEARESMRDQLAKMHEGVRLMTSYCNGIHSLQQLRQGDRASAAEPYRLFQSRVYIGEELGLIANLVDMDHQSMPQLDEWLMRCGRWKKLLPLNKCILVSRVRRDKKDYGNVFESLYHNTLNMESLVWIRDGDNVWRFATDIGFEERVFPSADDTDALARRVQESIWKRHYCERGEDEWPFNRREPSKREDPAALAEPAPVKWLDEITYLTLQAFIDSEHYPAELNLAIHRQVGDAIRRNSRESMPFALLLQGLIDFKGILSIPAGTDIFDPEQQAKHIQLVADFSGALTDPQNSRQFGALTKPTALKPGDRIIGWRYGVYKDEFNHEAKWNVGSDVKGPFVFTVHHVEPKKPDDRNNRDQIFVHHWELSRRWVFGRDPFTSKMGVAPISSDFLPADLPAVLAARLLDDRDWKREHTWAVPILAQWEAIRKQFRTVRNETPHPIKLKGADDL